MFGNNLSLLNSWKKPKVGIYVRVSTQLQADDGYGIDSQINICRKTCEIKNYEIYKIYKDEGVSGTTEAYKRYGFKQLLEDIKLKYFNIIVLYSIDRLGRDIRVVFRMIDELKKYNIKLIFCKESIDTNTEHGNFMFNIYASVADHELNMIRNRLHNGYIERKNRDGEIGGKLPYGYIKIDKKIRVNKDQSTIIHGIFNSYYDKKFSMNKIANILTNTGIKTSQGGKRWYGKTIKIILNHEDKYKGGLINNNNNNIKWPVILI